MYKIQILHFFYIDEWQWCKHSYIYSTRYTVYIYFYYKKDRGFFYEKWPIFPTSKSQGGVCSCVRHLVKLLLSIFLLMIMIALYTIVLKIYIITALDNKIWSYFVDISSISNRQWTINNTKKFIKIGPGRFKIYMLKSVCEW